jgi:2-C-methyl-D-erythritol 4-phosphate cytidylyltransferase
MRAEILLVHDAARPLAPADVTSAVIRSARRHGAAAPGVLPSDTVKQVTRSGRVIRTLPRDDLRLIQTPQGFRADLLRRASAAARARRIRVTDDSSMVEAAGYTVRIVSGDPEGFKVTTSHDLGRLRESLRRRRGRP